jgi:hypothetical protein
MVYLAETILLAQEVFGKLGGFDPAALLEALGDAATVRESAENLALIDVLESDEKRDLIREFLTSIPPAIDAAMVAAVRNALGRGLRTGISWQPGYAFELRVWDVTRQEDDESWRGMVNVHLVSRDPELPLGA